MNHPQKSVLITGGARRLGAAMAQAFHHAGYGVALHYRSSKTEAESLIKSINGTLYQADLTDDSSTKNLIEQAKKDHPNLCLLINNASTFRRAYLRDSTAETIAQDLAINLQAPLNLMREYGAQIGTGSIINMLDTAIHGTHPAHFAYLVAKKGLAEATKMAAREYIGKIRVNGICPGHVLPTEGAAEHEPKHRPVKPTPEQVVQAALLLAENQSYTGQFLNIDGGDSIL